MGGELSVYHVKAGCPTQLPRARYRPGGQAVRISLPMDPYRKAYLFWNEYYGIFFCVKAATLKSANMQMKGSACER